MKNNFCLIYRLGNVNVEQNFYSVFSVFAYLPEKCVLAVHFAFYFRTSVISNITFFRLIL